MPSKVLVVDGDTLTRETIGGWLSERGYEAEFCTDLATARPGAYEIVIADIQWPCQQGMEVIMRLRGCMPHTPLIAISEFADRELEAEAVRSGAGWFLTKPLNLEELQQALEGTGEGSSHPESGFLPGHQIGHTLLRGFNADEQWDFRMTGSLRNHAQGETIPLGEEASSLIWLERGTVGVFLNGAQVEVLSPGDYWGEESFVHAAVTFIQLIAQEDCQVRHFSRKRLIDFFAYHDETLTKRYMINLILCLQLKWKRSLTRLSRTANHHQEST